MLPQNYQTLHKQIYQKMLDELDGEVIKAIMSDPECEEAVLLNVKVHAAVMNALGQEENS